MGVREQQVSVILERIPETIVNPSLLCAVYWKIFDDIDLSEDAIKKLRTSSSPEAILRARRRVLRRAEPNTESIAES